MIRSVCKHDEIVCPRCGTICECKVGSINLCQCMSVELTEEQRHYVDSLFSGCLCANCLLVLRAEYVAMQSNCSPNGNDRLMITEKWADVRQTVK